MLRDEHGGCLLLALGHPTVNGIVVIAPMTVQVELRIAMPMTQAIVLSYLDRDRVRRRFTIKYQFHLMN